MNDEYAQQLVAELLEVNEQAIILLTAALAEVAGRQATADALARRLSIAQAAGGHPMALAMLDKALKHLQAN